MLTKIVECNSTFLGKLDYSFISVPMEISITLSLPNYSIDLMSIMNFKSNFAFWKHIGNRYIVCFKQPNNVVTWDLDTGKVISSSEIVDRYYRFRVDRIDALENQNTDLINKTDELTEEIDRQSKLDITAGERDFERKKTIRRRRN